MGLLTHYSALMFEKEVGCAENTPLRSSQSMSVIEVLGKLVARYRSLHRRSGVYTFWPYRVGMTRFVCGLQTRRTLWNKHRMTCVDRV